MDKQKAWELIGRSLAEYHQLKGEALQKSLDILKPEEEPKEE